MEHARKLETRSARIATGLDKPSQALPKGIAEVVTEFMGEYRSKLRDGKRSARYVMQVENRINRVIAGVKAETVDALDAVEVRDFLDGLTKSNGRPISGITRNEYVNCIKSFTAWCKEAGRTTADPLSALKRTERKDIAVEHRRRALTVEQVVRLLEAAERRPERELLLIRRGNDKGKLLADVRPAILAKAKQLGAERRLTYLLPVWTGLRRSELRSLQWGDVFLDTPSPHLRLRAETTKAKRADAVVLHAEIAAELRRVRPASALASRPLLRRVPGMKAVVADLKFAGIDPGNEQRGFIDLHSMRKTLSTMMASAGLKQ